MQDTQMGARNEDLDPRRLHSLGKKWSEVNPMKHGERNGSLRDIESCNKRANLKATDGGKGKIHPHAKRKRGIVQRTVAKCVVTSQSYGRRESGVAGRVGFAGEKHTSQHIMAGRLAVCVGRGNEWAGVNDSLRAVVSRR